MVKQWKLEEWAVALDKYSLFWPGTLSVTLVEWRANVAKIGPYINEYWATVPPHVADQTGIREAAGSCQFGLNITNVICGHPRCRANAGLIMVMLAGPLMVCELSHSRVTTEARPLWSAEIPARVAEGCTESAEVSGSGGHSRCPSSGLLRQY